MVECRVKAKAIGRQIDQQRRKGICCWLIGWLMLTKRNWPEWIRWRKSFEKGGNGTAKKVPLAMEKRRKHPIFTQVSKFIQTLLFLAPTPPPSFPSRLPCVSVHRLCAHCLHSTRSRPSSPSIPAPIHRQLKYTPISLPLPSIALCPPSLSLSRFIPSFPVSPSVPIKLRAPIIIDGMAK